VSSCAQYARNFFARKKKTHGKTKSAKKSLRQETAVAHTAIRGAQLRTGRRQSIPSSNTTSALV
jgi:hypothetical protein